MIVRKLDHHGREVWRYPATVIRQEKNKIVIEAPFNRDDMALGYTTFRRGDRFVEYFYNDRWYNIFVVYAKEGGLRGWYCNICRPAVWDDSSISCEDLALDVWIPPQGDPLVLDEDEFATLEIPDAERLAGRSGLQQLLDLARSGGLPR